MKSKITLEIESTASLETAVLWEIAREEKLLEVVQSRGNYDEIEEKILEEGIQEMKEIAIQIARWKWKI